MTSSIHFSIPTRYTTWAWQIALPSLSRYATNLCLCLYISIYIYTIWNIYIYIKNIIYICVGLPVKHCVDFWGWSGRLTLSAGGVTLSLLSDWELHFHMSPMCLVCLATDWPNLKIFLYSVSRMWGPWCWTCACWFAPEGICMTLCIGRCNYKYPLTLYIYYIYIHNIYLLHGMYSMAIILHGSS